MEVKTIFLIFGTCAASLAVIVTFVGLRVKSFPNRPAMLGLIALGLFLVAGTATFGIKLQMEEAEEREAGDQKIIGESATVNPIVIPANIA